jgi:L-alanine-DL-glutamate epimerase-like enolase superfamily enzyme
MRPVKVKEASVAFRDLKYRTPLKFGSGIVDAVTDVVASVEVEMPQGDRAVGHGEILLGDLWAFPSEVIGHEARDAAMRWLTVRVARWLEKESPSDHPLAIGEAIKEAAGAIAADVTCDLNLPEPIPPLAAMVCLSPLDAAVHDAFGKAYQIDTYDGYGPGMCDDLSRWLGGDFRGRYLSEFITGEYRSPIPLWHLVGGLDKLRREEKTPGDPHDGLPVSLDEWIERDGVFCFKIKLRGNDLEWDLTRTQEVFAVARECSAKRGCEKLFLSVDTNEQCESPEYCVAFLKELRAASPEAFDALLYLEQPTERDLGRQSFDMRPVAAIKPVVADEGIQQLDDMDVAFELGWSGTALKTCKGQTFALLTAAKTAAAGKIYTIQDLTNPGLALMHSVGMAARLSPLKGVEANARQFIPFANESIAERFPGLVNIREGVAHWPDKSAFGLGY